MMTLSRVEAGSFRDRHSRVFYRSGTVFRGLSEEALTDWNTLSSTRFFPRLMAEGKLVRTEQAAPAELLNPMIAGEWAAVLTHQTIPFISYPYEWSFCMLKDAALLHLELLDAALAEDMILKDASAYNVQWIGTSPTFIDIPSFETLIPGTPWVGYRQFCQLFLYPLLLQAYKDVPFQPWLRGSLEGIEPEHCNNFISTRDLLRPGVLTHVYLQAKFQRTYSKTKRKVKSDLMAAGFTKNLIQTNLKRLEKLINTLTWTRSKSQWSDYADEHGYGDADHEMKQTFVREVAMSRPWGLVWDLGCNTGMFSRIVAEHARYVVAMDADHLAIERFYNALKTERNRTILPLINNIADASPNLGWRGLERKSLTERGRPELTLCLALIHHIVLSANIPLKEFTDWLASLGTNLIIEFVTKQDPMVEVLLRNKADQYADYEVGYFEECLAESFAVSRRLPLRSGTRILYYGTAKL